MADQQQFPLETIDDNLASNEHLYQRHEEANALLQAYRRRTAHKPLHAELILLNGVSGSGKTVLARAFGRHVVDKGGIFVAGKCMSNNNATRPYAPIVEALEQFVDHALDVETEATRASMREIIQAVVGPEWNLLVEMAPCLRRLSVTKKGTSLDDFASVDSSERSEPEFAASRMVKRGKALLDKQNQLAVVLRRFLRAICSGGGPSRRNIVLFLDDLHAAETTTLDLIRALVSPCINNNQGLMLIGSCRGDEVDPNDTLSVFLRDLEQEGTRIKEIVVPNLSIQSVSNLIGDMTNLPPDQRTSLAQVTFQHTNGNPFFVIEFLRRLERNHALFLDANNGVWVWREEQAAQENEIHDDDNNNDHYQCDNYIVERMKQLPQDMQEVLMGTACLGGEIRESFICWALGGGASRQDQVRQALELGNKHGYWEYCFEEGIGRYKHDKFLEASLELIPPDKVASLHLFLGRNLQENAINIPGTPKALPTFLHLILCGKTEIVSDMEKGELASLCLEAAKLMAKSSAFAKAIDHVVDGINLLSENHWEDQYELSLRLFNAAAELAYCNGDHDRVDHFAQELREHARVFEDGLQADTTLILSMGSRGMNAKAGMLGIRLLRQLGEPVPSRVSRVGAKLEIYKARRALRGKSDEDILALPKMRDGHAVAVMSILHVLYPIALMSHIEYTALIACRLIRLTLDHGLCSYSSVGFAFYGSALARIGKVNEGCRFGELSLKILKKHPTKELMARALQRVGLILRIHKQPFRYALETLFESNRLAMMTGDLETAFYSTSSACGVKFWTGEALESVVESSFKYMQLCNDYGQHHIARVYLPVIQACHNLMGKAAENPTVLTGEIMNEKEFLARARQEHNTGLESLTLMIKYVLATYLNEVAYAESLSVQIRRLINGKLPPMVPIMWTFHQFFEGLVAVALASKHSKHSITRNRELRVATRKLKIIRRASNHCPENMANKALLIEADLAASQGKFDLAESKYRQSIVFADHEGFLAEQALASEKLALMLRDHTNKTAETSQYFVQARNLYAKYGATILVDRVTKELEVETGGRRDCDKRAAHRKRASRVAAFSPGSWVPPLCERDLQIGCELI
ncbi:expressed unknown protein [Seminavis robusta]|uniref:AAA+ ATPase domain-containing protein n=1 Tax=Seminavis robusta TaxID=568900 RepID=A0A9N8F1E9_9STRA|nr:expressed unknown protein [Seminavis robusta]|eukprot:Sro2515_g329880.1 n/a (1099) ;mRNA; f:5828-9204